MLAVVIDPFTSGRCLGASRVGREGFHRTESSGLFARF